MWTGLIQVFKLLLQLLLIALFFIYFGLPAINRYHEKQTMIVKSQKASEGIEGPTVTILARNNNTKWGWKQKPVEANEDSEALQVQCKDLNQSETVHSCIENETFQWGTVIKDFYVGGLKEFKQSKMNNTLWIEDFTVGYDGRYYSLTIPRKIGTNWRKDQVYIHLNAKLIYDIYVHEKKYFIISRHSFGIPVCHRLVDPHKSYYYELVLTEHTDLNLPDQPCEEDRAYDFGVSKLKITKITTRFRLFLLTFTIFLTIIILIAKITRCLTLFSLT